MSDLGQTGLLGKTGRLMSGEPEKQDRRKALSGRGSAGTGEGNLNLQALPMLKQTTEKSQENRDVH